MRAFLRYRAAVPLAATLVVAGCGGGSSGGSGGTSLSVNFTESANPLTADFVKLQQKSKSGARVVVDVVIGGPDANVDIAGFAFDIKIGDPSILQFVSGSGTAGDALVAANGQTVVAEAAPLTGDASDIVCGVHKLPANPGNGLAASSAVVLELAFQAKKAGSTTLTIAGNGTNDPTALDPNGVAIGTITFDTGSATVQGVSN